MNSPKKTADSLKYVVVGGGMAGLTAAVYLAKAGKNVILLEKNAECGGLLTSFEREGFTFDAGARSIENSGVIRPMLKDIGLDLELLPSPVSVGLEQDVISTTTAESLLDYKRLLEKYYPDSLEDIDRVISIIQTVLKDMEILYGVYNQTFLDMKDKEFLIKELLPWLGKFLRTVYHINKNQEPVELFLKERLSNQSLIDIVAQHFFKHTPMFFALGYFYLYLDYFYPRGGTGELPRAIAKHIVTLGGNIRNKTTITKIHPIKQMIVTDNGEEIAYDYLIWAADMKYLYQHLSTDKLTPKIASKIASQKAFVLSKRGGDSVFTLNLGIDEPLATYQAITNGHFFYTPSKQGLGETNWSELDNLLDRFDTLSKADVLAWVEKYCRLNTYEISIPAMRDPTLTPEGKTGMVISFFFEYDLIKKVQDAGWYKEFKTAVEDAMIQTLSTSIFPDLDKKIILRFSASPLTLAKAVGSSEGAITGWSFGSEIPAITKFLKIAKSVNTPIPRVFQAGQWTYSPSGIPIAILTGSQAAKAVLKKKH